jgi:hypothetical protein
VLSTHSVLVHLRDHAIFLHDTWILEFKNYLVMVTCGLHRYVNSLILYHGVVGIALGTYNSHTSACE